MTLQGLGIPFHRIWLVFSVEFVHSALTDGGLERLLILASDGQADALRRRVEDADSQSLSQREVDQRVEIGRALNSRYFRPTCEARACLSGNVGFGKYTEADVRAEGMPHARSLASAEAVHAGLFPRESRRHLHSSIPVYARSPEPELSSKDEICSQAFLSTLMQRISEEIVAPRLLHYRTHAEDISCVLSLLGTSVEESFRLSTTNSVVTVEIEASAALWEERRLVFRYWDADSTPQTSLALPSNYTVATFTARSTARRLQDDACQCPSVCEAEEKRKEDIAVEIHEKELIGIIVGITLGPVALSVLALQAYRLRTRRPY